MKNFRQHSWSGERALFQSKDLHIENSIFHDGESPLKESRQITLDHTIFQWKYPLWYCQDITMKHSTLLETARSGIWYTHHIDIQDSMIEAVKTFRRSSHISLQNVDMPIADETLWNCSDVHLQDVRAKGDYFGMNIHNAVIDNLHLSGNYCFDGGKNIEIHHSTLLSKDAFWNCENVTVYDSTIIGEYLGWNSQNITFVNCTIESLQGLCYIQNLKLVHCQLLNTTLAFEFCENIDAQVVSHIDSIMNPISGKIIADSIGDVIIDYSQVNPQNTQIITKQVVPTCQQENICCC